MNCTHRPRDQQVDRTESQSLVVEEQEAVKISKTKKFLTKATNVAQPLVSDSAIDGAIHILDGFAEFGKAIPFIAPAFVLLKVIVDIEKRAQDADAKCTDLIQRINFMLGEIVPPLKEIEIKPSIKKVGERINSALEDAAALIAAYRKQGRVARRLSFSNREKFSTCAETINGCCRDLIMSLQIWQSLQLDILTRDIPTDEEDEAANSFVADHGGDVEAVVHNLELVTEFATERNFIMDDTVMEQLNIDIEEVVRQNHSKLEVILRDNVNAAVANGFKDFTLKMNAMEAEQKFKCVQCDKEFTDYSNGPKACSYHRAEYDPYSKHFPCCTTSHPCQFNTHRSKHHCEYPYGSFFSHIREVAGYINTREELASVEEIDLETDMVQTASVSKVLSWFAQGPSVEENTLLIMVGEIGYKNRYYFNTFTSKELQDLSKTLHVSGKTTIYRTAVDENEYSMAEWLLSPSGTINGVQLTAKCTSAVTPCVRVCPIDIETCTKSGDVLMKSEGGFPSYTPSSAYNLPDNVTIGPTLTGTQSRPARTDFKSKSTLSFPLVLKTLSDPPLSPTGSTFNMFRSLSGKIMVYNNSTPDSLNAINITSITAFYRMVGDPEYLPVDSCTLVGGSQAPFTVEPHKSCLLDFLVVIPQLERKIDIDAKWWDKEFQCRHRPIRVKIVVKDIMDEECSLVLEHVFKPTPFLQRTDGDVGFFFLDDPQTYERHIVNVKYGTEESSVVRLSYWNISSTKLQKAVYHAIKTGETDVELLSFEDKPPLWEWTAWALVDVSCRRVYAIKIIIKEGKHIPNPCIGFIGYVLCPTYGRVIDEQRVISHAKETAGLPPLGPCKFPEYSQDDDFDDDRPPQSQELTPEKTGTDPNDIANLAQDVKALQTDIASINANLQHVAASVDRFTTMAKLLFVAIFIRLLF